MDLLPDPRILCTRHLARVAETHAVIDSTNLRAKELARSGAPHGLVVVAERTDLGSRPARSRVAFTARRWPLRVVCPPPEPRPQRCSARHVRRRHRWSAGDRTPVGGGGEVEVAQRPSGRPKRRTLALKKVGGVLSELSLDARGIDHVVVGLGLNLREVERPEALVAYATSLEALAKERIPPTLLLAELANALEDSLDILEAGHHTALLEAWRARALGIGARVTIHGEHGDRDGVFIGVTPDGALLLETPTGTEVVYAGDLRLPGRTTGAAVMLCA